MGRKKTEGVYAAEAFTTVRIPLWVAKVFTIQGNGVVGNSAMASWAMDKGLRALIGTGTLHPEAEKLVQNVMDYEMEIQALKKRKLSAEGMAHEQQEIYKTFFPEFAGDE